MFNEPDPLSTLLFRSRLLVLWSKSHSHSRLSTNILREVCEYLSYDHYPLSYTGEYRGFKLYLQLYDWERGQTVRLCQVHEALSDVALVYIRGNRVVVTGGLRGEFYADYDDLHYPDCACVLVNRRNYTHLPCLQIGRLRHATCYDPVRDCVYVLGGLRSLARESAIRSCESLDMQERRQWTQLAEMHIARWRFTPVVYKSGIYVAGGGTVVMETYDPVLDKFELLPFNLPDELVEERWVGTSYQQSWVLVCSKALVTVPFSHRGRPHHEVLSLPNAVESAAIQSDSLQVLDSRGRLFHLNCKYAD